jgi:hypothetical protein
MNKENNSFVYFIHEHGNSKKFKIGRSINPERRLKNLQTGNSRLLKIHDTIQCPSKDFAKYLEGALHIHYLSSCQGGEWFLLEEGEINKCILVVEHLLKHDIPVDLFEDVWEMYHHSIHKKETQKIPFISVNL